MTTHGDAIVTDLSAAIRDQCERAGTPPPELPPHHDPVAMLREVADDAADHLDGFHDLKSVEIRGRLREWCTQVMLMPLSVEDRDFIVAKALTDASDVLDRFGYGVLGRQIFQAMTAILKRDLPTAAYERLHETEAERRAKLDYRFERAAIEAACTRAPVNGGK